MESCLKKIRNLLIKADLKNRTLKPDLKRCNSLMTLYFQLPEGRVVNSFLATAAQLTMLQMHGEILRVACLLSTWYHTLSDM